MLAVTDAASEHIANLLDNRETETDAVVRLVVQDEGLTMVLDSANPDDVTYDHLGRTVLVMKPDLAEQLDGKTLQVEQSEGDARLTLN
jgi:Fe-S cluster assembly iron-binding protein IscA